MNKNNSENNNELNNIKDFADKELVDLKTAVKIIGLKYSKARILIYSDKTIGYFDFDGKSIEKLCKVKCQKAELIKIFNSQISHANFSLPNSLPNRAF